MDFKIMIAGIALGTTALLVGNMNTDAVASRGGGGVIAPDVIIGSLPGITRYGVVDGIAAYAVGTTSCNIGNDFLLWEPNNNNHPTIGQNMYRVEQLDNGCSRIEQIGMSWLKHGFCALQGTLCGSCSNPAPGGCPPILGWNCSDPYSSGNNGSQNGLGPKSEVNASTGFFPYPYSSPSYPATIGRRLNVYSADMDLASYPASSTNYFVEGQYIHPQDAAACKSFNNAAYREVTRSGNLSSGYDLNLINSTRQMTPAIFAWREIDPGVEIRTFELSKCALSGLNETFHVAVKVCDIGNGMWHYEYAVYNLDCDKGFQSFEVPLNGTYENAEQAFAVYHSNEVYDNESWDVGYDSSAGTLKWNSASYAQNQEANAIRWNTMHTFSFDTSDPPIEGQAKVSTFKDGNEIMLAMIVPNADFVDNSCAADLNGDNNVGGQDLAQVLAFWGNNIEGDIDGDGQTTGTDLAIVLASWGCTGE
jgi:hypothetical protein